MQERQNLEDKSCGVCLSSDFTHLFNARDYIYGNRGIWPVAKCRSCGVVFLNPRVPPEEIGQFYPKTYYTNQLADTDENSFRNTLKHYLVEKHYKYPRGRKVSFFHKVLGVILLPIVQRTAYFQHNIEFVPGGRVLDIGCGNGYWLGVYKRLGWQTHGTEVGVDCANLAKKQGHNIFIGELTNARYPEKHFDAVTLWDALEHIHNPAEIISEISRISKNDSTVYIYVPNYNSVYARYFRDKWFMFTAPLHYYHYTAETLRLLLKANGFPKTQIHYPLGGVGITETFFTVASTKWYLRKIVASKLLRRILQSIDRALPRGHLLVIARRR